MIIRHIPMKSIIKSSFAGLVEYIRDPQDKKERVGQIQISNCHSVESHWAIHEVLATQALNQRAKGDKTYHLLISFAPEDNPSIKTLKEIEERAVAAIGFSDHQRISVVHHDTDNLHIHVAINKIHPKRHTLHEPYRAYKSLGEIAQILEIEYGLKQTNHISKKVRSENLADDMEQHAGIESLLGWIKRNCLSQLEEAQSWSTIHHILNEHGLRILERGNGLIIANREGLAVKASSVSRNLSKNRLENRLGQFETLEMKENNTSQYYKPNPINPSINTAELYAKYQTEQRDNKRILSETLAEAKKRKHRLIEQAKYQGRLKRAAIKLIKGERLNKKILYGLVSRALQSNLAKIRKHHRNECQKIVNNYQRRTWADWLQEQASRGNEEALSVLRSRKTFISQKSNSIRGNKQSNQNSVSKCQIDSVTKEGTIIYRVGASTVRDKGKVIEISQALSKEELKSAINMAQQRFGNRIKVNGSELFQRAIVQTTAYFKMNVTFDDFHLEKLRQQSIMDSTRKVKSNEQRRQPQFNHRAAIGRNNEVAGTRINSVKPSSGGRRPESRYCKRLSKPNLSLIGRDPPPESKNGLGSPGPMEALTLADQLKVSASYLLCLTENPLGERILDLQKGTSSRPIPLLSLAEAPNAKEIMNSSKSGMLEERENCIIIDQYNPSVESPSIYAIALEDDSMQPDFNEKDLVIIDPERKVKPGNFVLAYLTEKKQVVLRKYCEADTFLYQLLASNKMWATINVANHSEAHIIGTVIEHRRFW